MAKEPAVRQKMKLRMLLRGPEGSGKTLTALKVLYYLTGGGKIGVIDTEHGRSLLYAPPPKRKADPERNTFELYHYPIDFYSPDNYVSTIREALNDGMDAILIDSLTHEWDGEGGILDTKAKKDKAGGNSFTNWNEMTQTHNQFLKVLLSLPIHLAATGRVKTDYVLEVNERGKSVPKKVGLALIQRETTGYEFDVIAEMDSAQATITKAPNLEQVLSKTFDKPGKDFAAFLNEWLGIGADMPMTREGFRMAMNSLGYDDDKKIAQFVLDNPDCSGPYKYEELVKKAGG